MTRQFSNFVKKHRLPPVSVNSLRHTNATLMIAAGINIRTISNRLGHAQVSTTSNIYAHAIHAADDAASEVIQNMLTPIPAAPKARKTWGSDLSGRTGF